MVTRLEVPFFAPVPVGHRVSVLATEIYSTPIALFGPTPPSQWRADDDLVVCDESSRIVYADASIGLHPEASYESLRFRDDKRRISQSQAPLRGVVVSCVALSDQGERINFKTRLAIEPDAPGSAFR